MTTLAPKTRSFRVLRARALSCVHARGKERERMFQECIVCGARTREQVTLLLGTFEAVPICSERCRRSFLHFPWSFLETRASVSTR
jgi:hypothetical protein